ncbi:MAG: hypothetical protein VB013_01040 [Anaerolineaceae bacterium]|nr:hypothetical protein [Anaerolineaceae bacterium]
MHEDPLNQVYPLCADASRSLIDPLHDHIWELALHGGEPPALDLRTTFGLRCLGMRLFPSFGQDNDELVDPRSFAKEPEIVERTPNYLRISCRPFNNIDVELEYWVPESNLVCGRVKLTNIGLHPASLKMHWNAILHPGHKGAPMNTVEMGVNTVMQGTCDDLAPVFFITGGPEVTTRSFPSLGFSFALPEKASRRLSWGLAALDTPENSIVQARHATSLNWDTELTRMSLSEKSSNLDLHCEAPGWDAWLQETQQRARQFIVNGLNDQKTLHLVSKRNIDTRLQDEKLLRRNSALNYEADVYQLWYLSRILLPANPTLFKALIHSTLETQQDDGSLPFTVSPAGTVSSVKAPPLLAGLVLQVDRTLQEDTWLNQIQPQLLRAYHAWFPGNTSALPTWESPIQTGLDGSPLFATWQATDQGLDVRSFFSPALAALLYKEGQALLALAQKTGAHEEDEWLTAISAQLREAVERSYDPQSHSYRYLDAQSGRCDPAQELRQFKHDGSIQVKRNFKVPRRLLLICNAEKTSPKHLEVTLNGSHQSQPVQEKISLDFPFYQNGLSRATSKELFETLESVQVSGLESGSALTLRLAGTDQEDLSLFLPLWAGIPPAERAHEIIEKNLLPHYLNEFGLSTYPSLTDDKQNAISPFWNAFLLESLLQYGYRKEAAMVLNRLYTSIFAQWAQSGQVNSELNAADGSGRGEHNTLLGLPPLSALLTLLSIESLEKDQVILQGFNDLFAPFTVQYERVMLMLSQHSTVIQTVNGSRTEIDQAGHYKILLP